MELVNDFVVNSPIDETWATLTDVEKIAPCLPGATLEGVSDDGNVFHGVVKVKVGPILANFKGEAQFEEKDAAAHRAVLRASGRDTGNKGNASALITAHLEAVDDASTKCTVSTDLKITGKFAQFGRGAMQDISTKLLGEFVNNLEHSMAQPNGQGDGATPAGGDEVSGNGATGAPVTPTAEAPGETARESDVLDLGHYAGPALAKRLVPILAGIVILWLLLRRRRRHD